MRRRRDCDRARAGRGRLPHPALPHARGHLAGTVDARDLHVRPVREARMRLEQRPEPRHVVRDRRRRPRAGCRRPPSSSSMPSTDLERADLHLPHLRLVEPVADRAHGDGARPDDDADVASRPTAPSATRPRCACRCPTSPRSSRRCSRSRSRARRRPSRDDLHDAVRSPRLLAHELGRQRFVLRDEVDVPVCVPARRCHRRSRPPGGRRRR